MTKVMIKNEETEELLATAWQGFARQKPDREDYPSTRNPKRSVGALAASTTCTTEILQAKYDRGVHQAVG